MDADLANELIQKLGTQVVQSDELPADWDSAAVVSVVDGTVDVSGYAWDSSGTPTPFLPTDEFDDYLRPFQQATQAAGEAPWKAMLIQVKRSDMQVKLQFEYDDATRWKVTPANMKTKVVELRP